MLIRPPSKTGRIPRPGSPENAFLLCLIEKQYFKKTASLILPNREALISGKIRRKSLRKSFVTRYLWRCCTCASTCLFRKDTFITTAIWRENPGTYSPISKKHFVLSQDLRDRRQSIAVEDSVVNPTVRTMHSSIYEVRNQE
jgi:hypothetical protein